MRLPFTFFFLTKEIRKLKMAKRFTDTMKWNEDWYLDLALVDKLFWIYICDNCDHAGIFKPNKRMFELLFGS